MAPVERTAKNGKLEELGVSENTVHVSIHTTAEFNRERQYRQRRAEWPEHFEPVSAQDIELPVNTQQAMLDNIENSKLFSILSAENKLTTKISGHTTRKIAKETGLTPNAIDLHIFKLKKKIKKFL